MRNFLKNSSKYISLSFILLFCYCLFSNAYSQCTGGNISNWTTLGPTSLPPCAGDWCLGNASTGVGRTTGIWLHPANSNILFLNSWHGGLYRTTNQGTSWSRSCLGLDRISVSAVAFDPDNTNIIYCATGDDEEHQKGPFNEWTKVNSFETATTGLFKSTDGGYTWAKVAGFPLNTSSFNYMNKTRIPLIRIKKVGTTKVILVAYEQNTVWPGDLNGNSQCCELADNRSQGGILRSTDNGLTWADAISNSTSNASKIRDIEFDPNPSSQIVYASGHRLWRSTDLGATWTNISSRLTGLDMSTFVHGGKIKLAVSAAKENNVYITAYEFADWNTTKNTRFWVSTDKLATNLPSPKINSVDFADVVLEVGQSIPSGYTEPIIYSTYNAYNQRPALLNRSIDGGNTFTVTNGYSSGNYHVDIRSLVVMPDNAVFMATDGGPYYSPATQMANTSITNNFTWSYRGNGLSLASVMGMSLSKTDDNVFIGCFDNSWMYYDAAAVTDKWKMINYGGDGGLALINGANSSQIHMGTELFNWGLRYSIDKGANVLNDNKVNLLAGKDLYAMERHPLGADTIWIGWCSSPGSGSNHYGLYRSTSSGNTWMLIKDFYTLNSNIWETIRDIKVSESNTSIMYVLMNGALYRSDNRGVSWVNRSPSGFNPGQGMLKLLVSPSNPNKLWISYQRQNDLNNGLGFAGVIYSSDGGITWQNFHLGLPPEVPVYSLCADPEMADDAIYAGTAHGVYYRDSKTNGWVCFNNNLPPIKPNILQINTGNDMVYAGLFGGGVWRSPRACNQPQYYYNTLPKLGTRKHIGDVLAGWSAPNTSSSLNINSGEFAEYVSARSVSLKPGFRASAGCTFRARLYNSASDCDWSSGVQLRQGTEWEVDDASEPNLFTIKDVSELQIIPNPNNGSFQAFWIADEFREWQIKDLYGRTLQSGTAKGNTAIQADAFAKGIYLFQVMDKHKNISKKVIIE